MIKALMVDMDGVLVNGRPADGLPYFTDIERDLGLPLERLQKEFFAVHWPRIIVGQEPIEPALTAVLSRIAPHLQTEALLRYWFENDSRLDERLLADLASLRNTGLRVYLATNQEHRRAAWLMDEHGLSSHFDGIFYSAALGCKKPSIDFFRMASERAGVAPSDIGFIDDSTDNIDAARRFGWQAVAWMPGMVLGDAFELSPL
jgi:putative hydrolase of the HAD superfamily